MKVISSGSIRMMIDRTKKSGEPYRIIVGTISE